jgi:NAD(P)-dependent dehydrogenase (short-subunit alcohol dehydrogenase family)
MNLSGTLSIRPQEPTMHALTGKVALVTGAGGAHGIGRAIALRLAGEGADVVVTDLDRGTAAFRPEDIRAGWRGIHSVADEIVALGRQALAVHGDVGDSAQVGRIVEQGMERFGRIDLLVNNAASTPGKDRHPLVEVEEDAFDTVLRVNLKGAFLCSKAVARTMIAGGRGGRIIMMSSCMGKRGRANYAAYSASKFGLIGLTQSLALELAAHRITVNAICPGPVDTERFDQMAAYAAPTGVPPEVFRASILRDRARETPLGRIAQPADVASVASFLASPEAEFLTGLAIDVTGGFELH